MVVVLLVIEEIWLPIGKQSEFHFLHVGKISGDADYFLVLITLCFVYLLGLVVLVSTLLLLILLYFVSRIGCYVYHTEQADWCR